MAWTKILSVATLLGKILSSSFFGPQNNQIEMTQWNNKQRNLLKQYGQKGGKSQVDAGVYNPQTEAATLLATTSTTP